MKKEKRIIWHGLAMLLLVLPTCLIAQYSSTFDGRRDWLMQLDWPANQASGSGKYGMPFAVARLYQSNGADAAAKAYVVNVAQTLAYFEDGSRNYSDEILFNPVGVVRAVHQWGGSFSSAQLDAIADAYREKHAWCAGGTENHELMRWSNGYLLAQKFGGSWYSEDDGGVVPAATLMASLKLRLINRIKQYYAQGISEYNSPNYLMHHVIPLANLYDFCGDADLKYAAEALMARHLTALSLFVHNGCMVEPTARYVRYSHTSPTTTADGNESIMMNWLYWGHIDPSETRVKQRYAGGPFLVYLALCGYRVPERLEQLANNQVTMPFEARSLEPQWHDAPAANRCRVWRTSDWAMGSIAKQFYPDAYYMQHAPFGLHWNSSNDLHYMLVGQPYWHSDYSERSKWLTATDSPFMQTVHYRDTAIILFNHPGTDPWPGRGRADWVVNRDEHYNALRTEVYAVHPATVDQRSVYILPDSTRWYFIKEGDVYIGLRVLTTTWTGEVDDAMRIIYGRMIKNGSRYQSAFVIEVGTAAEHGNFANFQQHLKDNVLTVDWGSGSAPAQTVTYTNTAGDTLSGTYNTNLTEDASARIWMAPSALLNGQTYDWSNWPDLEQAPYVNLSNSVLTTQDVSGTVTYDMQ